APAPQGPARRPRQMRRTRRRTQRHLPRLLQAASHQPHDGECGWLGYMSVWICVCVFEAMIVMGWQDLLFDLADVAGLEQKKVRCVFRLRIFPIFVANDVNTQWA